MRHITSAALFLIPAFQQPFGAEDLTALPLDSLIERLPRVGEEWRFRGDDRTLHPVSTELSRRLQAGVILTAEQWGRALLDTGALRVRQRWPVDVPFAISARRPAWLETDTVLILDPPAELGLRRARVGSFDMGRCGNAWGWIDADLAWQELGVLPPGHRELRVRLELWRRDTTDPWWFGLHPWFADYLDRKAGSERGVPRRPDGGEPRMPDILSSSELILPLEIVSTIDEVVPPASSEELDQAVRRSLTLQTDSDGRRTLLHLDPLDEWHDIGLSLDVEVLQGNTLLEKSRLMTSNEDGSWIVRPQEGDTLLVSLSDGILEDPVRCSTLRLRVHGTDTDVLRRWSSQRRWFGTLELPVEELLDSPSSGGQDR